MKFLLFILLLFILSSCAGAKWSKADYIREGIYVGLSAIDYAQTKYAIHHPNDFHELNPILPSHPNMKQLNIFTAVSVGSHILIANWLPSDWRKYWQYFGIGARAAAVGNNFFIGAKIDF